MAWPHSRPKFTSPPAASTMLGSGSAAATGTAEASAGAALELSATAASAGVTAGAESAAAGELADSDAPTDSGTPRSPHPPRVRANNSGKRSARKLLQAPFWREARHGRKPVGAQRQKNVFA